MKFKLLTIISLLLCSNFVRAKINIDLQQVRGGYTVEIEVPDLQIRKVNSLGLVARSGLVGETYSRIRITNYKYIEDIGKPELPVLAFYMAISDINQLPTFSVLKSEERQIPLEHAYFPAQIPWPKSRPLEERPFSINNEYYNSQGERLPIATVSNAFDLRGVPCIHVKVAPFSYNPSTKMLTVKKKFTLKISTAITSKITGLQSNTFAKYLRHVLVNFDDVVEPVRNREMEDYHIITAPQYEDELTEFVTFRKMRFNVTMVTTDISGNSSSAIESYIQDLKPTPLYVLLVGDVADIPSKGSPATDVYYASTDGDVNAEIFLGRFSVANSEDLANVVRKTIYQETNFGSIDKINVFIGGTDAGSGQTAERTHDYCINTYLDPDGFENIKLYTNSDNSATKDKYIQAVNDGVIWNIYSGHGGNTSWAIGPWSIRATDINSLTNETSYPFSYAFACLTGTYTDNECISESWMRAEKGAVTHIGSSVNSNWGGDDDLQRGIFDAIYDPNNPVPSIGGSMTAGKLECSSSYSKQYNLMGDPALEAFEVMLSPNISVKSPNGGNEYMVSTTIDITWSTNSEEKVSLYLLKGSAVEAVIVEDTDNDGVFPWEIPEDTDAGSDYKIRATTDTLVDESDEAFAIVKKPAIVCKTDELATLVDTGTNSTAEMSLTIKNEGEGELTYSIMVSGAGSIMINEVYIGYSDPDDGFELWNRGPDQDMTGWKVVWNDDEQSSGEFEFKSGFIFKSGETIVLDDVEGGEFYLGKLPWQESTEMSIALLDANGVGVDFVRTAGNSDEPPQGTSWDGDGVDIGEAYVYRIQNEDTDSKADWDKGTSGTINALNPGQSNSLRVDHWVVVDPDEGTVAPKSEETLILTFNGKGLEIKDYYDTLLITHDDPDNDTPIRIPVKLTVDALVGILPLKKNINSFGIRFHGARIFYQIPDKSMGKHVSIKLYDLKGKVIKTLVNGPLNSGFYSVRLDKIAHAPAAGLYFCRMKTKSYSKVVNVLMK